MKLPESLNGADYMFATRLLPGKLCAGSCVEHAMGHPLRWKILCTLGNKEMSVGEIVEKIGTSQSNVSQHLDQLRNKNIVSSRRDANRIYYRVRNDQLLELIGTMRSVLCRTNLDDLMSE
jgi:DNA-binding transcriptional ArsR family regulator